MTPSIEIEMRPISAEHITERYVGWLNDPFVNRWLETRWETQNVDTVRSFLAKVHAEGSDLYAIHVDGQHAGNIKLGPINRRHESADLSYFIGERSLWGKGIATGAVKYMVDLGFKQRGLHRIQAGTYAGNVASQRVLRKAGFVEEGRLKQALKTENGWSDHVLFGITNGMNSL